MTVVCIIVKYYANDSHRRITVVSNIIILGTQKDWRTATRARPRNASSNTQPSEKGRRVSPSPMSDRLQRRLPASFVTGAWPLRSARKHHTGDPGPTEGQTLDGGTMWSGVPDHLRQLPSHLCRRDREAASQAAEGAPAPWFPSKWPPSGTQPQLHQGGCSGETPRELGLVPSRCGWVDPHCRRTPVVEPWSRSSHPPPDLQTAVVVTWP